MVGGSVGGGHGVGSVLSSAKKIILGDTRQKRSTFPVPHAIFMIL